MVHDRGPVNAEVGRHGPAIGAVLALGQAGLDWLPILGVHPPVEVERSDQVLIPGLPGIICVEQGAKPVAIGIARRRHRPVRAAAIGLVGLCDQGTRILDAANLRCGLFRLGRFRRCIFIRRRGRLVLADRGRAPGADCDQAQPGVLHACLPPGWDAASADCAAKSSPDARLDRGRRPGLDGPGHTGEFHAPSRRSRHHPSARRLRIDRHDRGPRGFAALRLLAAGAGRGRDRAVGGDRPFDRGRLARDRARQSPRHGSGRRRSGGDRARARLRAGSCRQCPCLSRAAAGGTGQCLSGAGTIMSPNGQWRCQVALPDGVVRTPPAEYDRPSKGFPRGRSAFPTAMRRWPAMSTAGRSPGIRKRPRLAHPLLRLGRCRPHDLSPIPAPVASSYAVIGHAPRHLDRNIATVGRVVEESACSPPARAARAISASTIVPRARRRSRSGRCASPATCPRPSGPVSR